MSKKKDKAARRQAQQQPPAAITAKKNQAVAAHPMLNWLLVAVAIIPFLITGKLMDPAIALRYSCLSAFILLFVLYFYGFRKKLLSNAWPLLVKIVFILGIAYGCWNLLSFFNAANKQQVYFGLGRHLLNILFLFIVTHIAEQEERSLSLVCKLLTIAAMIHSFVGIAQFYDMGFTSMPGNFLPYGFMANRNLFGSAQVLLLPFAVYTLYKSNIVWKYLAGFSMAGIVISSILSQTRSSWLAALIIIFLSLILISIFSPVNRKKWIIGTFAGIAVTVLLTFLVIKSDTEGTLAVSLKERTSDTFTQDTTANKSGAAANANERVKIWKKTIQLIKDNPLTGVGAGNWKVVMPKYGSEGLAWAQGFYVPDRPHNDYLLIAAESGVPGLLLYLAMWLLIAWMAFSTIRKTVSEDRRILNILMLSLLAAFAADSMFSFPNERIEHCLYVFLAAGIIMGTYMNNTGSSTSKKSLPIWLTAIFLLIAAFNLLIGTKKFKFENQLVLSKLYEKAKLYQRAIEEGNKGKNNWVTIDPNGFPIETYIALGYKGLKQLPEAMKEINKAISYHPYNKALLVNKGTIYTDWEKYDSAILYYNKALVYTPSYNIIYYNLAINYFQLHRYKECLEALSKADISNDQGLLALKREAEAALAAEQR